jgi:cholesterol transport system auxiliary component
MVHSGSMRLFNNVLWVGAACIISACSMLQAPRMPPQIVYLLDVPPAVTTGRPAQKLVLAVSLPRAWPGFDTAQMAYVREPQELNYFEKSRWADAPSRMLLPIFARGLAADGRFDAVVSAPMSVAADLRLDTEIVRLVQDFGALPSRVHLTVRAQLVDLRSSRMLATREFEELEPAASEDAAGGAGAANRALARMLRELADFCAEQSARR